MAAAPILMTPDSSKPFCPHVDTSEFAAGEPLTLGDEKGRQRVIAYAYKKLTPAEKHYTANDKELLALVQDCNDSVVI